MRGPYFLDDAEKEAIEHERDELMLALMKVNRQRERLMVVAMAIRKPKAAAFFRQHEAWQDSPEGCAVWHWLSELDEDDPCDEVAEHVREYPEAPK